MFEARHGTVEFLFRWGGRDTGWGTNIVTPPSYNAKMQHWSGRLSQMRTSVVLSDPDGAIRGTLSASGTTIDGAVGIFGRLVGESWGTLWRGQGKGFTWEDGLLTWQLGDGMDALRGGRFVSNYYACRDEDHAALSVESVAGSSVYLSSSIYTEDDTAVVYSLSSGEGRPVRLSKDDSLVFDPKVVPGYITNAWEHKIKGFGISGGSNYTNRIDFSTDMSLAAIAVGDNIFGIEPQRFVGDPMTLLRAFMSGSCSDVGWVENTHYEVEDTDIFNQTELEIEVNSSGERDVSVLSYIDEVCKAGLISVYPARSRAMQIKAYRPRSLTEASDGTLVGTTDLVPSLSWGLSDDDLVTHAMVYYGYSPNSNSPYGRWKGRIDLQPLSHWPHAPIEATRTREIRMKAVSSPDVARIMGQRILARHYRNMPTLKCNAILTAATVSIADQETIVFPLDGVDGERFEVVSIRDALSDGRISLDLLSATTLYQGQGAGAWEDSVWCEHDVSGTSTFGWADGTLGVSAGTCQKIDADEYGTVFRWS